MYIYNVCAYVCVCVCVGQSAHQNPVMALECVFLPTAGELFECVTACMWADLSFLMFYTRPSSTHIPNVGGCCLVLEGVHCEECWQPRWGHSTTITKKVWLGSSEKLMEENETSSKQNNFG